MLDFKVRKKKNLLILYLQGELDYLSSEKLIIDTKTLLAKESYYAVIFNLKDLCHIDSSGLAFFAGLVRRNKEEIRIRFCDLNEEVSRVINITGLHKVFDIDNSENESIKFFNESVQ